MPEMLSNQSENQVDHNLRFVRWDLFCTPSNLFIHMFKMHDFLGHLKLHLFRKMVEWVMRYPNLESIIKNSLYYGFPDKIPMDWDYVLDWII